MRALFFQKLPAPLPVSPQSLLSPLGSDLIQPVSREMARRLQIPSAHLYLRWALLLYASFESACLHSPLVCSRHFVLENLEEGKRWGEIERTGSWLLPKALAGFSPPALP